MDSSSKDAAAEPSTGRYAGGTQRGAIAAVFAGSMRQLSRVCREWLEDAPGLTNLIFGIFGFPFSFTMILVCGAEL